MPYFQYDHPILERFPNLAGGALVGKNLRNRATPEPLWQRYLSEQQAVLKKIGSKPLSELVTLAGWRAAFRLFGVDPTQYRSAAEALLRRLTKKGDIPSINAIVDICNLVSIRYALPVAVFDLSTIRAPITVQFATGNELFTTLGEIEPAHPDPGEVIFMDAGGLVVARRWCWRQSEAGSALLATTEALFTIEAHHPGGRPEIEQALTELQNLLETHAGGEYERVTGEGLEKGAGGKTTVSRDYKTT